nr:MAG TPA: regulatory protein [Caudoviricetes sp.]
MEFIKPDWKIEAERRGESLPGYWTFREACRMMDIRSVSYMSMLYTSGKIVAYKVGNICLIKDEQLQMLMDKR